VGHLDPRLVAERVSHLLSVSVNAQTVSNSGLLSVRLAGLDRPNGCAVEVSSGLAFVNAHLVLDSLARSLLRTIEAAPDESWEQLLSTLNDLSLVGVRIELLLNGVKPTVPVGTIESLAISGRLIDYKDSPSESSADLVASVFGVLLFLLPMDSFDQETGSGLGNEFAVEGSKSFSLAAKYERSRSNRAIAIVTHGTRCQVCGLDFQETYGPIGAGYVEIHHLTPVHLMEAPRVVNPVEELVPLCANCHRMVHKVDPPFPPAALREIVLSQKGKIDRQDESHIMSITESD
jgi:hypothetical protein